MRDLNKEFASLLYTILVSEKRWLVKDIAAKLDMKYDTFYARVCERVPFSPQEMFLILKHVPDQRLANFFLLGSAFLAVKREEFDDLPVSEGLHRGATRTILEASDILREVECALSDSKVDHQDLIRIRAEVDEAERALASLKLKLK